MASAELIGLNTKFYRHKNGWTQEKLAEIMELKTAYLSLIERGETNLTLRLVDLIAHSLGISPKSLLEESTAEIAKTLPVRVDFKK